MYSAHYQLNVCRNTQLFRTLFHEIGHYVDYWQKVLDPSEKYDSWELLDARRDAYFQIPGSEKERFAHEYAKNLALTLQLQHKIPFPRLLNDAFLVEHGLRKADFDENAST